MNSYPAELRREVVLAARARAVSTRELAREFGVSQSCVQRWLKVAAIDGYPSEKRVKSSPPVDQSVLLSRVRELERNVAELQRALERLEDSLSRNERLNGLSNDLLDATAPIADGSATEQRESYYR